RRGPARHAHGRAERLVRVRRAQRRPGVHRSVTSTSTPPGVSMTLVTERPATTEPANFRDPVVRLQALFDPGTLRPLAAGWASTPGTDGAPVNDTSGAIPARGMVNGSPVIAFA